MTVLVLLKTGVIRNSLSNPKSQTNPGVNQYEILYSFIVSAKKILPDRVWILDETVSIDSMESDGMSVVDKKFTGMVSFLSGRIPPVTSMVFMDLIG